MRRMLAVVEGARCRQWLPEHEDIMATDWELC
jgi:hypothetical protein